MPLVSRSGGKTSGKAKASISTQEADANASEDGVLVTPFYSGSLPVDGAIVVPSTSTLRPLTYGSSGQEVSNDIIISARKQTDLESTYRGDWKDAPLTSRMGVPLMFRKVRSPFEDVPTEENMFANIISLDPYDKGKGSAKQPSSSITGSVMVMRSDGQALYPRDIHALWDYVFTLLGIGTDVRGHEKLLPKADLAKLTSLCKRRDSDLEYEDKMRLQHRSDHEKVRKAVEKRNDSAAALKKFKMQRRFDAGVYACWVANREDLFVSIREIWVDEKINERTFAKYWRNWAAEHGEYARDGLVSPVEDDGKSGCVVQ